MNNIKNGLLVTLLIAYLFITSAFVWNDTISSFASDSIHYILMALYMSPWQEPSLPVQLVWAEQHFPPFFPMLLAISGAVHNFIAAHLFTNLFLVISLPLIFTCAKKILNSKNQALMITIIFSICPSVWVNTLGILSENIYIFISFLLLIYYDRLNKESTINLILLGILFSILMLTRSIGIAMVLAFSLTELCKIYNKKSSIKYFLIPVSTFLVVFILIHLIYKLGLPISYIQELNIDNSNNSQYKYFSLSNQFLAIFNEWHFSWLYYWSDNQLLQQFIIKLLGVLTLCGIVVRIYMYKIDAFYTTIYLLIILFWPYPGQISRFLYPILPLALIYAIFFTSYLVSKKSIKVNLTNIVMFLLAIAIIPTLSYTYNRYKSGEEYQYNKITEFYHSPNLQKAKINASIQTNMLDDMDRIKKTLGENEKILYFTPSYIAALSNKQSRKIKLSLNENKEYTVENKHDGNYVYLSRMHPRKTRENINGLDLLYLFDGWTQPVWVNYSIEDGDVVSILLKIIH